MRHSILFSIILLFFLSCNESVEKTEAEIEAVQSEWETKTYPADIAKVFEAHGGLQKWNANQTLVFTMTAEGDKSVITTDLKSRKALIESDKFNIGYDGQKAWVSQDSTYFEGDPNFYYDLMFYFYAMPFVLSDDGINYSDVDSLNFNGLDYPGIKISYNSGVGASPEDEYILYYHPDTHKMEWLGYTVTYFSKEKSDEFRYIKYDQWQDVDGIVLPKTMQWYGFENDSLTSMKNERSFTDVALRKDEMPAATFSNPNKEN